jgi:hypothetical protein
MKRCPVCQRTYVDDSLSYCLEDGSALYIDSSGSSALAATLIIPDPRVTAPAKQETFRPNPPPQSYPAPHPQWSPVAQPQTHSAVPPRQGRGAAVTSLVSAIAAFLLLGFCIIAGAAKVDESLIGGVFIFSAFIALVGAVLGIVAVSKGSKDTSAQNSKTTAVVALVLNGFYLLISIVFLILGAVASTNSASPHQAAVNVSAEIKAAR